MKGAAGRPPGDYPQGPGEIGTFMGSDWTMRAFRADSDCNPQTTCDDEPEKALTRLVRAKAKLEMEVANEYHSKHMFTRWIVSRGRHRLGSIHP